MKQLVTQVAVIEVLAQVNIIPLSRNPSLIHITFLDPSTLCCGERLGIRLFVPNPRLLDL